MCVCVCVCVCVHFTKIEINPTVCKYKNIESKHIQRMYLFIKDKISTFNASGGLFLFLFVCVCVCGGEGFFFFFFFFFVKQSSGRC